MASRMRWSMNHADFGDRLYFRSISRAETPFPLAHISNTTNSQVRMLMWLPWNTVPVVTENCLRQVAHFHTRRCVARAVAGRAAGAILRLQEVELRIRDTALRAHVGLSVRPAQRLKELVGVGFGRELVRQ